VELSGIAPGIPAEDVHLSILNSEFSIQLLEVSS
jgi:hypothetical protein